MKKRYSNKLFPHLLNINKNFLFNKIHEKNDFIFNKDILLLVLKQMNVHKSWYKFFIFQYKEYNYLYVHREWNTYKTLSKNHLNLWSFNLKERVFLINHLTKIGF